MEVCYLINIEEPFQAYSMRDDEKRERSSKVRRVKDNCGDVRRGGRRYFLLPGAKN